MNPALKKQLLFLGKLAVAAGIIALIFRKIFAQQDTDKLWAHLAELSWPLVAMCAVSFGVAIGANVVRWRGLLKGQGIHAPWSYLASTFMIARFFSAAGGLIGLSGFRLYDVATRTGKTARAAASIGVELVIGNLAMGLVSIVSCLFGIRYVGSAGVTALVLFFGALIAVTGTILWKPGVVRVLSQRLPRAFAQRLQTMVEAVCAYEGKGWLLPRSVALGALIHICNNMVYVFAAKALGVDLPITELFFVSTLQNIVSHLPITPNGVGLREATAVGLYAAVGLPMEQAVLIPMVGFAVDMTISSLGGLVLLARKSTYKPVITVDDAERESQLHAQIERVPQEAWPRITRGAAIGLGAGLLSGLAIGVGEAAAIVQVAHGRAEPDVWFYGALSYALLCGMLGMFGGAALAWSGRLLERRAVPEPVAFAHLTGAIAAAFTLIIGAFRVQRDVYHEELVWKSAQGVLVLGGALLSALAVYGLLFFGLRALTARSPARVMLRPLGSLGLTALVAAVTLGVPFFAGDKAAAFKGSAMASKAQAGTKGGHVLFIVVDTLRADHLPACGYTAGKTPHLDAFAKDAVRFEQAYANASWTRPSFASLMTGRYASSHGVMSKAASLPDGVETIAESFSRAGYATAGIVTNYNVAPFFNFQQGFDEYAYLTPNFLFGASDTAAKLSLLQIVKRVDEKARAALNRTEPGSAYQDAQVVNEHVSSFLDRAPKGPWFLFAAFMDPHDPYFVHPYNGQGYSRAAHVKPDPSEADALRKLYDGEITFWDEHFGKLVADLKRRGLYDDLTIVITADHGEEFMDHGGFWHGTTLYDEQLHVPLFIKLAKGERAGTTVPHWVESVDVMPSLLSMQGVAVPEGVQGVDLFRGKAQTFAEESHDGNVLRSSRIQHEGHSLKLIVANPNNPRGLKERELYRVDTDPKELKDVAADDTNALSASQQELDEATKQARTGALKAREVDLSMDKAAQDRLKALGYAGE